MKLYDIIGWFFVAIFTGFVIGLMVGHNTLRKKAVELGHAQYNPTNANFEWKQPPH